MSELPHVRVVRGTPDDVELAALVAGLVAATAHADPEEAEHPTAWSDRARGLRGARSAWRPGPETWRWSAR
ncbi:acyl-CoA carboxylase epsilon subunit [Cellulomonas sp. NPDC089187]|uniref:acyl-CoA carboxylase epsilon subunit n=1 Tax=Cellulomonas sp. NPDC089187 TaxID=3154970 RepID=UPI0034235233